MRAHTIVALALVLAAADCAGARHAAPGSAALAPTAPLRPCETRAVKFDGAGVVVTGNADGSLASAHVVKARNTHVRRQALHDAYRTFGPVRRESSVVAHESKWGLTTWTDRCGNPVLTRP